MTEEYVQKALTDLLKVTIDLPAWEASRKNNKDMGGAGADVQGLGSTAGVGVGTVLGAGDATLEATITATSAAHTSTCSTPTTATSVPTASGSASTAAQAGCRTTSTALTGSTTAVAALIPDSQATGNSGEVKVGNEADSDGTRASTMGASSSSPLPSSSSSPSSPGVAERPSGEGSCTFSPAAATATPNPPEMSPMPVHQQHQPSAEQPPDTGLWMLLYKGPFVPFPVASFGADLALKGTRIDKKIVRGGRGASGGGTGGVAASQQWCANGPFL